MSATRTASILILLTKWASGQGVLEQVFHIPTPPSPPLMNVLTATAGVKFATDPDLPLKGRVSRVEYQERNTYRLSDTPPALLRNLVQEFDEMGRMTAEEEVGRSKSVLSYRGDLPLGRVITNKNGQRDEYKWTYDAEGRLADFKTILAGKVNQHFAILKYDAQGRVELSEHRQGPDDTLFARREYDYSSDGRRITETRRDEKGRIMQTRVSSLDANGRVVEFEWALRDSKTGMMRDPRRFRFKYDEKGRVIEQDADPEPPGTAQDEQTIPAGKMTIVYDDANSRRTASFPFGGGEARSTLTLDENGAVKGLSIPTPVGIMKTAIECTYDTHGNWTECKRWATQGSERRMSGWWTRIITYR
jgi:hypothetical protein